MRARWSKPLALGAVLLMAVYGGMAFSIMAGWANEYPPSWGMDYELYKDFTQRWLDGKGFYLPEQLAGPYDITILPPMYPPVFLWFMVPFVWLPGVLWWALPIGAVTWWVWRSRPSPWTWAAIAACLAFPRSGEILILGNPTMWIVAFSALGLRFGWPSVGVLLKPSLFPFALPGIKRRSWWIALAVYAVACIPFGAMWADWVVALVNANQGALYNIRDVPIMLIPLLAWFSSTAHPRREHRLRDLLAAAP